MNAAVPDISRMSPDEKIALTRLLLSELPVSMRKGMFADLLSNEEGPQIEDDSECFTAEEFLAEMNLVSLCEGHCEMDFGTLKERKELAQEAVRKLTDLDRDEIRRQIATHDRSFTPEEFLQTVNSD